MPTDQREFDRMLEAALRNPRIRQQLVPERFNQERQDQLDRLGQLMALIEQHPQGSRLFRGQTLLDGRAVIAGTLGILNEFAPPHLFRVRSFGNAKFQNNDSLPQRYSVYDDLVINGNVSTPDGGGLLIVRGRLTVNPASRLHADGKGPRYGTGPAGGAWGSPIDGLGDDWSSIGESIVVGTYLFNSDLAYQRQIYQTADLFRTISGTLEQREESHWDDSEILSDRIGGVAPGIAFLGNDASNEVANTSFPGCGTGGARSAVVYRDSLEDDASIDLAISRSGGVFIVICGELNNRGAIGSAGERGGLLEDVSAEITTTVTPVTGLVRIEKNFQTTLGDYAMGGGGGGALRVLSGEIVEQGTIEAPGGAHHSSLDTGDGTDGTAIVTTLSGSVGVPQVEDA